MPTDVKTALFTAALFVYVLGFLVSERSRVGAAVRGSVSAEMKK